MSDVVIVSTTDSPEAVLAAQGGTVESKAGKVETTPAPETAETLGASEPQDEAEELDGEEPEETADNKPKKNGVQKRFSTLTKQREQARKEADEARRMADHWRKIAESAKPQEQTPDAELKKKSDGEPKQEDFATHEAWQDARTDWRVEQKLSTERAKAQQESLKSEESQKISVWRERQAAAAKERPDYQERMEDIADIPMSITIQRELMDDERGPEILYELAKDVEEYKRICALPATACARALGMFEAKLSGVMPKVTETKTTKAPKPPSPIGSGKTTSTKDPSDMDFDEFKVWRQKQLRG